LETISRAFFPHLPQASQAILHGSNNSSETPNGGKPEEKEQDETDPKQVHHGVGVESENDRAHSAEPAESAQGEEDGQFF